jgi:signal transduction histidine kinase
VGAEVGRRLIRFLDGVLPAPPAFRGAGVAFTAALLFLIVLNCLTYLNTARLVGNSDWVLHTLKIMNRLDSLALEIEDAGQAGNNYLLTPGEGYGKRFDVAADEVSRLVDDIDRIAAQDPGRKEILASLRTPIALALDSCRQAMKRRRNGPDAARDAIQEMTRQTTEARNLLIRVRREEDITLRNRTATTDAAAQRLTFWLVAGSLLNGLVLLAICRRLAREVSAHALSEASLSKLSAVLEVANRELQARNEELRRASRRKSDFVSHMSHELRTPLNAISGYAELLAEENAGALNADQRRFLGHVRTGSAHLLKLVDDLLDLARIEAGRVVLQFEPVDVGEVVPDLIAAVQPLAGSKKIHIENLVEHGTVVRADRTRLRQVLLNLLGNAAKFTADAGRVVVAASCGAGEATISVTDTGIGIPVEEQSRIFDDFYQAGSGGTGKGAGLGLSIARQLVVCHGGSIWVESEPGKGSCFQFTLPLATPRAHGPKSAPDDGWGEGGYEDDPGGRRRFSEPEPDSGHPGPTPVRDRRSLQRKGGS